MREGVLDPNPLILLPFGLSRSLSRSLSLSLSLNRTEDLTGDSSNTSVPLPTAPVRSPSTILHGLLPSRAAVVVSVLGLSSLLLRRSCFGVDRELGVWPAMRSMSPSPPSFPLMLAPCFLWRSAPVRVSLLSPTTPLVPLPPVVSSTVYSCCPRSTPQAPMMSLMNSCSCSGVINSRGGAIRRVWSNGTAAESRGNVKGKWG